LAGFVIASPARAQQKPLSLDDVNRATFSPDRKEGKKTDGGISPVIVKAQVLLDRARFSPGVIDGHPGENVQIAIKAFETENGLEADGKLDEELWKKLNETSADPALFEYTITKDDVDGPFVEKIPDELEEMAKLDRLGYRAPEELLAEKFHMDQDLLKALNPDKPFDKAGTRIAVAKVDAQPAGEPGQVRRIEVRKSEKTLHAFAEDGKLVAVYPATIGSDEKPAPSGTHQVKAVAPEPTFTYNPEYAFKGVKAKKAFVVEPGPNNRIHGTPEPAKVGKTYSHGCIRLTNWDAEELAKMVEQGTEVTLLD
jgi:lipoprotein-anchoring transpeptidase ErfK/SrfK